VGEDDDGLEEGRLNDRNNVLTRWDVVVSGSEDV
jgi:hypothetical protein